MSRTPAWALVLPIKHLGWGIGPRPRCPWREDSDFSGTNPVQILDLTWVLYLRLINLSVGDDVPIDSETFLVTNFINLKIKPTVFQMCS
jgi:hypothetical protein